MKSTILIRALAAALVAGAATRPAGCIMVAKSNRVSHHFCHADRVTHRAVSLPFLQPRKQRPPHIHVTREEMEANFWLRPVSLAANHGFAKAELIRIEKLVEEHCQKLLEASIERHGN